MAATKADIVRAEQGNAAQVTAADTAKTEIRIQVSRPALDTARRKPALCSCSKYHTMEICIIKI